MAQIQANPSTLFTRPLTDQIAAAEAKFDAGREQALLRKEARHEQLVVRGLARAVRGRYYARIQRGY